MQPECLTCSHVIRSRPCLRLMHITTAHLLNGTYIMLLLEHFCPVVSKSKHFCRCNGCIVLDKTCNMDYGIGSFWSLFYVYVTRYIFLEDMHQNNFHISTPVTSLAFEFWPKTLLPVTVLVLTSISVSLNVVCFSVCELTVGTGQKDRQDVTHNVLPPREGCIKRHNFKTYSS